MALMFARMIPIYGRAIRGNLARLFPLALFLVLAAATLALVGIFGVADLALGTVTRLRAWAAKRLSLNASRVFR